MSVFENDAYYENLLSYIEICMSKIKKNANT